MGDVNQDYEEEATQQATQQLPAHHGIAPSEHSGEDYTGIICFLHPCSTAAIAVVQRAASKNPGMIHRLPIPQKRAENDKSEADVDGDDDSTQKDDMNGQVTAVDLALRYQPGPKDPCMGYLFGRNPHKCDVVIVDIAQLRRVSNQHFRIFVNNRGALMLEDLSTNGTWVDGRKLGADSDDGRKRVLSPGSIIHICPGHVEELVRFIVRIPKAGGRGLRTAANSVNGSPSLAGIDPGHLAPPRIAAGPRGAVRSPNHNQAHIERNPLLVRGQIERHGHFPQFGGPLHAQLPISQPIKMDSHTSSRAQGPSVWAGDADYSMAEQIGKGAFASVNRAWERKTGEAVAVKVIAKRAFATQVGTDRNGVKKEVEILEKLVHPNIVKYITCYEDQTHIHLVMEFIEYGDLNGYLHQNGTMPEDLTKEVTVQVLRGIEYIHAMGISHRDLKPDNILIAEKSPITVKISDFGLAKMIQNEETFLKTFCGTMLYLAPEVFPGYISIMMNTAAHEGAVKRKRLPVDDAGRRKQGKTPRRPYNQAVDMWSLGCVVYALLCGSPPFEGKSQDEMFKLVTKTPFDEVRLRQKIGGDGDDCVDFLRRLLQVQPEMRMMEVEAMRHPWIYKESSFGSSMEGDEESFLGFENDDGYSRQGMDVDEDDEDEEEEDSSGEEGAPTPRKKGTGGFFDKALDSELPVTLAQMKVGQPRFDVVRKSDSPSSANDVFESVSNSANEFSQGGTGLSVIDRARLATRGEVSIAASSGVMPDGLSMFDQKASDSPESDGSFTKVASSGALEGNRAPDIAIDFAVPRHRNSDTLNGAESKLDRLHFATATPSPYTTPPPQPPPAAAVRPSFSFADANANANFSPESLKNQSPATPTALRRPLDTPSDENLPATQIIVSTTSNTSSNFIRPPVPWGRLVPLPGSLPIDPISLLEQVVYIGRSTSCTHRPQDVRISKHHLAIQINHHNKALQTDPTKSRVGEWSPENDMVVTFHVLGSNGVTVCGKTYKSHEVDMLCDGDEILLFRDRKVGEFMGFRAELNIGFVKPEDRHRFKAPAVL